MINKSQTVKAKSWGLLLCLMPPFVLFCQSLIYWVTLLMNELWAHPRCAVSHYGIWIRLLQATAVKAHYSAYFIRARCAISAAPSRAGLSHRPLPPASSAGSTFDLWTLTLSVVCCFPSSCISFFLPSLFVDSSPTRWSAVITVVTLSVLLLHILVPISLSKPTQSQKQSKSSKKKTNKNKHSSSFPSLRCWRSDWDRASISGNWCAYVCVCLIEDAFLPPPARSLATQEDD